MPALHAAALAQGVAHHLADVGHHHAASTSFVALLPIAKQSFYHLLDGFRHGEELVQHWVHDKVYGPDPGSLGSPPALPDQARMVEYVAKACPHCKALEPAWRDAVKQWNDLPAEEANQVVWQQKECYDQNWNPGADAVECNKRDVDSFPSVYYYTPGDNVGEEFSGNRSASELVNFAKIGASGEDAKEAGVDVVTAKVPEEFMDMKMVDYYAAGCPHCKHLEPEFDKAVLQWDKHWLKTFGAPMVSWEKKECLDAAWKPGKDFAECEKQGVEAFPTVRLFKVIPHKGLEETGTDFEGERTSDGLVEFVKREGGAYASKYIHGAQATADAAKDVAAADSKEAQAPLVADAAVASRAQEPAEGEDIRIVDYYADACPHCKDLEPTWEKAVAQWQQEHPTADHRVAWEKRECLDGSWQPGKDYDECLKQDVSGFPTVRLFKRDPATGLMAEKGVDFEGPRTHQALLDFVGQAAAGPSSAPAVPSSTEPSALEPDDSTAAAAATAAQAGPGEEAPAGVNEAFEPSSSAADLAPPPEEAQQPEEGATAGVAEASTSNSNEANADDLAGDFSKLAMATKSAIQQASMLMLPSCLPFPAGQRHRGMREESTASRGGRGASSGRAPADPPEGSKHFL